MTDTDIRDALRQATDDLRVRPDLLDHVRTGGHRRVLRRRTLLAAGLATVAAGSTAGVLSSRGGGGDAPVASRLLDRPTRGDLKGDTDFLNQVRGAWRDRLGGLAPAGEPHVAWAGLAPHRSRVAVVAQRVPRLIDAEGRIRYGLTGFVEQTAGGPRVMSVEEMLTGTATSAAALLGPERDILMVVDDGRDVRYSPALSYTAEGRVRRGFTPLDFRAHDGVVFEATEPSTTLIRVALRAEVPDSLGDHTVGLANLAQLAETAGSGIPRADTAREVWSLAGAGEETAEDGPWDVATDDDFHDQYGYQVAPPAGTWFVRGATADRRRFVVQTMAGTDNRIRVLLSLGAPDPVLRGFARPDAPLPVRVRLPDGQGVVVAGRGRLRYRVSRGTWLPVAGNAALLPAAAAEAEVTPPGGRAIRIPLP